MTSRQEMVVSTLALLREQGLTGTSVRGVVAHSGAPQGSVYHYFPGGKVELVEAALDLGGAAVSGIIDRLSDDGDPRLALSAVVDLFRQLLEWSEFQGGCAVAAVAGEMDSTEGRRLAARANRVFTDWCAGISRGLVAQGIDSARANSLAALAISALEGALLLCRAKGSIEPLNDVAAELDHVLVLALEGTDK
jgi:AcrR family transcriptional regulator